MFRISKKVVLNKGDKIRVSGGPYFLSKNRKISMGEKGVGVFLKAEENGEIIHVLFDKFSSARMVYIGPDKISETTGTHFRPHKIVKLRK